MLLHEKQISRSLLLAGDTTHGVSVEGDRLLQLSTTHFHHKTVFFSLGNNLSAIHRGGHLNFSSLDGIDFGLLSQNQTIRSCLLRSDSRNGESVTVLADLGDHFDVATHRDVLVRDTDSLHERFVVVL